MSTPLRKSLVPIFLSFLLVAVQGASCQEPYEPTELSFLVYKDGYVAVDFSADVDPTKARVNVSLFGDMYLDVLIEDQDELPLDSSPSLGGLTIDTLGSITVLISYVTVDLTGKAGQIWSFAASTPISSTVLLPEGSTIVSLSAIPLAMGSLGGNLVITMPPGDLELKYTIGVTGTREYALAVIRDAEETIQAVKAGDVMTPEADDLLRQANEAFDAKNYPEAEQLADQTKASALGTQEAATSATEALDAAGGAITLAYELGRTVGLEEAQSLLEQAEEAYAAGNYAEAETLAEEAESKANSAEKPKGGVPLVWLAFGVAAIAIGAIMVFFMRKRPSPALESKVSFDLDALFDEHRYLRLDDKEVLRFLAGVGGEAFAAEIRDRFDVPRTSLWRMIRRLEREEVVEVENIGGQSLVRISQKYRSEGDRG